MTYGPLELEVLRAAIVELFKQGGHILKKYGDKEEAAKAGEPVARLAPLVEKELAVLREEILRLRALVEAVNDKPLDFPKEKRPEAEVKLRIAKLRGSATGVEAEKLLSGLVKVEIEAGEADGSVVGLKIKGSIGG